MENRSITNVGRRRCTICGKPVYPDWFIKKKVAYQALCDALKQCEEFMGHIKSLL